MFLIYISDAVSNADMMSVSTEATGNVTVKSGIQGKEQQILTIPLLLHLKITIPTRIPAGCER